MRQKTFIKLTAWLLAIAINGLIVVVYLNVKGLDGGFLTQIEKGDASLESGDLESALKHYLKAVSIAPDSPLAYLNASATYVSLGDSESAMALMEEYLATSPHSVESYEYLLSLYEQNNVSPQKQFALLSEAALLFPDAAFADRAGELKLQLAEVDAPLLTPEPGSYEDTLKVTISNYEEGDEIFYTDNGDQPTRASTRYDPDKGISHPKRARPSSHSSATRRRATWPATWCRRSTPWENAAFGGAAPGLYGGLSQRGDGRRCPFRRHGQLLQQSQRRQRA